VTKFLPPKENFPQKIGIFSPSKNREFEKKIFPFFFEVATMPKIPPSKNNPTDQYNLLSLFKTLSEFKVL